MLLLEIIKNIAIQYTIVGIIILGATVWIMIKAFKKNKKRSQGGCCGCSLKDSCNKVKKDNCDTKI